MFGRNQKKQPQPAPAPAPAPVQREPQISDEDRELLESIANELRDSVICTDGEILLDDAIEVSVCTVPYPILEIIYDSFTVEMAMTVHRFDPDE